MAQRFDRDIYFAHVRDALFSGAMDQQQVDGQGVLIGLWEGQYTGTPMKDVRWLAYLLGTVFHECAKTMWPISEYGKGQGKEYGQTDPETGQAYYGRGFVMCTWRENYSRASKQLGLIDNRDLEWHPELALDSLIAARMLFRGCAEGWWTGRKLGEYFNNDIDDPVGAREIVNGHDQDTLIASYHAEFLTALEASAERRSG